MYKFLIYLKFYPQSVHYHFDSTCLTKSEYFDSSVKDYQYNLTVQSCTNFDSTCLRSSVLRSARLCSLRRCCLWVSNTDMKWLAHCLSWYTTNPRLGACTVPLLINDTSKVLKEKVPQNKSDEHALHIVWNTCKIYTHTG